MASRSRTRRHSHNSVIPPAIVIGGILYVYTTVSPIYQILMIVGIAVFISLLGWSVIKSHKHPKRRSRKFGIFHFNTTRKGILNLPKWTSTTVKFGGFCRTFRRSK